MSRKLGCAVKKIDRLRRPSTTSCFRRGGDPIGCSVEYDLSLFSRLYVGGATSRNVLRELAHGTTGRWVAGQPATQTTPASSAGRRRMREYPDHHACHSGKRSFQRSERSRGSATRAS